MNRIIFQDGKAEAEKDEMRLIEHRTNIVAELETARLATVNFLGREVEYEDLEPFINEKSEDRKERALKLYLEMHNQSIPKLMVKLSAAMITPTEVKTFLEGLEALDTYRMDDPKRYWDSNAKIFAMIPVSKEEKAILIERNRVYCAPDVDPDFARFAFQYVRMINKGNKFFTRYGGGTKVGNPDFPEFLKPLVIVKTHRISENGARAYYEEFALVPGTFTVNGNHSFVFDERLYDPVYGKNSWKSIFNE
jgi:hypothetical protein